MLRLITCMINYRHEAGFRIDRPAGNTVYTILLFRQSLQVFQDGQMVTAPEDSCLIFQPFAPQLYYSNEHAYYHDGIFFDGEVITPLLEELGIPINHIFAVSNPKRIITDIQRIELEAAARQPYSDTIIDLRIRDLIYTIAQSMNQANVSDTAYYAELQQLRQQILSQPEKQWSVSGVADQLHISTSYFQHLYNAQFGVCLKQEIVQARIAKAKYYLRVQNNTIQQVGEMCGYSNTEHFIRQFKKYTGKTPKAYRQNQ